MSCREHAPGGDGPHVVNARVARDVLPAPRLHSHIVRSRLTAAALTLSSLAGAACSSPTSSSSAATGVTVSATTLAFPATAIGQSAIAALSVSTTSDATIGISDSDTADFPYSTTCTVSLPAGASCPVTVEFQPVQPGVLSADLTITSSTGKTTVALSGTATGTASARPSSDVQLLQILTAEPNPFYLAPGQTAAMRASALLADGTAQDVTTAAAWSSSDASVASVSPSGVITAMAGGGASVTVEYQGHIASIRVLVAGSVAISPSAFAFPPTSVGQRSDVATFTVSIGGGGPNMLASIASSDPIAFPVVSTTCDETKVQPTGYTCIVVAFFNAMSAGPHSAQIAVTSVEPSPATTMLTVTGTGR